MTTIKKLAANENGKNSLADINANFAALSAGKQARISVTVGPANADYLTDGTADDVQINAAIVAMNAAGGGTVFLQGVPLFTSGVIKLLSNVWVVGAGMGVTVVNASVGNNFAFDTQTIGQSKTTLSNIFIKDLTIAGVSTCHNAIIRNCTNAGYVRVEAYQTDFSQIRESLVLQHIANAYFLDTFIHDCTGDGVQVNGCDYGWVRGNRVTNFYTNVSMSGAHHMDDGIDIDEDFLDSQSVPCRWIWVEDNVVDGITFGNNIRIASSQYVFCRNNISINHNATASASILVNSYSDGGSTHPDTHHIYVDDNEIIGGTSLGVKVENAGGSAAIHDIFVRRNSVSNCGASAGGQLGGGLLSNCDNVVWEDNLLDNCGKTGGDGGAIIIYKVNNQILRRNRVINSPGNGVNFWNGDGLQTYTGIAMEDTEVSGNGTDYANLSVTSFTNAKRNQGLNPSAAFAIGNITGSTTITRVKGDTQAATLTGNVSITLTSGVVTGDILTLILTQDATGSRTASWPGNFKKAGGTLPLSTGANAVDQISMVWNATNWIETSRALNAS